jgi:pantoate--beta-alanine ligase
MELLTKILSLHSIRTRLMLIFQRQADLQLHLQSVVSPDTTIGFVPTMGALHDGHLSLMSQSLKENDLTAVSIFVNPTQFNNPKDLEKYPRDLNNDINKINSLSSTILIYAPAVDDIYNNGTLSENFDFDGLENQMEGKHRPGHFNGVGTVVKKLFEIVHPTNAYFGEKDFQQLQIIKKLVDKYELSVNVIGHPVFRENNGLAMSSRNERLSATERDKAGIIFETLVQAKEMFVSKSAQEVSNWVNKSFAAVPGFKLEYFEIADEATLLTCTEKFKNKKYRAFIAVFVNEIRLIDTISLN